jgi:serine/threonine-protein kinase
MSSDFLSQFSKENYNRTAEGTTSERGAPIPSPVALGEPSLGASVPQASVQQASASHAPAPHASIQHAPGAVVPGSDTHTSDDMDETGVTSTPNEYAKRRAPWGNAAITAPEHDVEYDRGYDKRKLIRYGIVAGTVIAVALIIFLMVSMLNRVTVKNFVGTPINDAKTWGITNRITIETETIFSLEYDNNMIASQSKEANSKIRKGSVLVFQVSQGADPDERIELPDFNTMSTAQVNEWKSQNKANSVNIMQENSDIIETGRFIRKEFSNAAVTESNYTRKDGLLIYMSKGPFEENITVPDFAEKSKEEADSWAKQNKIQATYTESSSDKIPKGFIISQDIEAGTKIAQSTIITFLVSSGKVVTVPNFNSLTKEEAAAVTDMAVTVKTQYNTSVAFGRLISQSIPAGRKISEENPKITVIYSEGKPFIDNLLEMSEKELQSYFYEFTSKGAKITYSVSYVDSAQPKGQIVWASMYSQFVAMNAHVQIHVSKGNLQSAASDE